MSNKIDEQIEIDEKDYNYEDNFFNYFQLNQDTFKDYDIVKNSKRKHNPLNDESIQYLKFMETFDYNLNSDLPTVFIFNYMHGQLRLYFDELLNKPYYETLPSTIDMWRLKPVSQHNNIYICPNLYFNIDKITSIPTPKKTNKKEITKYFKDIINSDFFYTNEDKKLDMFEINEKHIPDERNQIVFTKQQKLYINKLYSLSKDHKDGIYFCKDITFEFPIGESEMPDFINDFQEFIKIQYQKHDNVNRENFGRMSNDKNYISYKKQQNLMACPYFIAFCYYINDKLDQKHYFPILKRNNKWIEKPEIVLKMVDLFYILLYFKNCKLVYTDTGCESIQIKDKKLEELIQSEGIEKFKVIDEIKKLRRSSMNKRLRGGNKTKRFRQIQ
jgi:hypothetical protein